MLSDAFTLTTSGWVLLAAAALLMGISKTSVSGIGLISVSVFAAVLPARLSTGALLPLLLVGDVVAVLSYRAHAQWRVLLRLMPSVAVGLVLGTWFLAHVDDVVMRRTIGAVVLGLVVAQFGLARWQRGRTDTDADADDVDGEPTPARRRLVAAGYGSMAGFTTMVANAGGPAMALYLLAMGAPVLSFLGTASWFFFLVNVTKVPFSVGLGLVDLQTLRLDAALAGFVLVGTWLGRRVVRRLSQQTFELLVVVTTVLAGLNLLLH